ncbi:MAG TPA: glycosyltransferase family 4 protein [Gemmatimonadaceae bacterium]|nr:glycosyltransferase family 4 protein [Gemmatimonadaceae bacterium]
MAVDPRARRDRQAIRPARIYAFAEYYPDPFKPYFDTQFAHWVADGHDLSVFAFGSWGDAGHPPIAEYGLDERTTYLPAGPTAVWRAVGRVAGAIWRSPSHFAAAAGAANGWPRRRLLRTVQGALLPAQEPDVCLVHNLMTATSLISLRRLYPGARIALYYHGGETAGTAAPADVRAAFADADIVCTNTHYSRQSLLARGCPAEKVRVIPLGYDLSEFKHGEMRRRYRPDGALRLITVSRLSTEKGLTHLLDALVLAGAAGAPVVCTIVGDGPERAALEHRVTELGLRRHVRFTGVMPRNRVLAEFDRADALVLPSVPTATWEENQACVLQEAMLSRLMVITTRTGGVPESIAPAMDAFAAPPSDPVALADRICRVARLKEPELEALGRANRAYCESRYDIRVLNPRLLSAALGRSMTHDRTPRQG